MTAPEYTTDAMLSDFRQIIDYLRTPPGRVLADMLHESERLSMDSLLNLRSRLTDPDQIALADLTIAYKRTR